MSVEIRDRVGAAALIAALLAAATATWLLLSPSLEATAAVASPPPLASGAPAGAGAAPATTGDLVIDVQGGVQRPGIVVLPAGSRVADALQAAGGYADDADLAAAASALNLAAALSDGQQVYVPLAGIAADPGPGGAATAADGDGGGLVNLNTATPEALEALPGVGPVTVQKIVAARAERAFTTLDELVDRKVLNRGQLEDIRDLVTV